MIDSIASLRRLKRRIAVIEQRPAMRRGVAHTSRAPFGHEAIDLATGGGLSRGRLHEVFAADAQDAGSAAGFVGMLAIIFGGPLVWLREDMAERHGGTLHASGLRELGMDPARLIVGLLPDPLAVLRAAADVVRCPAVGVAVIELRRNPALLDLTAGRRLALAAEGSGVTALLLRVEGAPAPSAADTRWAVRAAASLPLAANAPGHPAIDVELLRQRGRAQTGRWQMEWDRDQASFRDADARDGATARGVGTTGTSASGAVFSFPGERPAVPDHGRRST